MQRRPRPARRLLLALVALPALTVLTAQIVLAEPPAGSLTISHPTAIRGETISFGADVTDPDGGTISSYEWDFGDGNTASGEDVTHAYSSLGTKTVTLTVTDSANETSMLTGQVTVENQVPTASFTVSNTAPARGQLVGFDATASDPDGDSLAYEWDFGDSTTATGESVTHAYAATTSLGARTVTLTVTDSAGGTTTDTQQVTVQNAIPNPDFSVSDTNPDIGETVTFDGSASSDFEGPITNTNHDWDLDGNGSFESTGQTTSRSYSTPGPVTVRLQVQDSNGATAIASQTITVNANPPPTAAFTISHVNVADGSPGVDAGETVNFDGSTSTAGGPSDTITKYEWDLDGNPNTGLDGFEVNEADPETSRSYTDPGPVDVRLRVTNGANVVSPVASTPDLRINARPIARIGILIPQAEAGQRRSVPLAGQPFQFTAGAVPATPGAPPAPGCPAGAPSPASQASGDPEGGVIAYGWEIDGDNDFNDATTQNVPVAGYPPGLRTVGLRVTDSDGASHTATLDFRVNTPPAPGFVLEPVTPVIDQQVTFSTTSGDPDDADGTLTHSWDIDGDGMFCEAGEQGANVQRVFTTAGPRTIKLRVTDTGGITRELTREVLVQNTIPTGSFGFSPDAPVPGQSVTFSGSASSPTGKPIKPLEWNFDFNPAAFDPDQFAAHATGASVNWSFPTAGPRTVALKVSEEGGGFRIVTGTIVVNAPPRASFLVSEQSPFTGAAVTMSSTSQDPDGPLAAQQWDLDNDGQFDDAAGPAALASFATPGVRTVRLRVTDSRGAISTAASDLTVRAVPPPPPPPPPQLIQGVVVSIKGTVVGRYTKVRRLLVRAPQGADVRVRCVGKSCPKKGGRASRLSAGRQLRFKQLERRMRSGTRIIVQVTRAGFVGRMTRFRMRTKAAPKRMDLCLPPGAKKGTACTGW